MPTSISDPKAAIAARARQEGFDLVRVTGAEAAPGNREGLTAYLAAGHHGDMDWMATRQEARTDPRALWPAARSIWRGARSW